MLLGGWGTGSWARSPARLQGPSEPQVSPTLALVWGWGDTSGESGKAWLPLSPQWLVPLAWALLGFYLMGASGRAVLDLTFPMPCHVTHQGNVVTVLLIRLTNYFWSFLWAWHLVSEPRGNLGSSVTRLGRRRPPSRQGPAPGPVTHWAAGSCVPRPVSGPGLRRPSLGSLLARPPTAPPSAQPESALAGLGQPWLPGHRTRGFWHTRCAGSPGAAGPASLSG